MKISKLIPYILSICFVFSNTSCNSAVTNNNPNNVNVIMINDNHGMFNESEGGIDRIAAGINYYSSLGNTLKIANGDIFQGTYVSSTLKGLPMLDALNAMNFDAFVLGNHEFDWGLDEIKKYKDGDPTNGEANFPFLGANIYDKDTNKIVDWLEPYTIVNFDNIKIGVIGVIGEVEDDIKVSDLEGYEFIDAAPIVKELSKELRVEKDCDAVIVTTHGNDFDFIYDVASYEGDFKVDGIFTGHTHTSTNYVIDRNDGSKVYVLQNGGYGESFANLKLEFNTNGELKNTEGTIRMTSEFNSDGSLSSVFDKYQEYIDKGKEVLLTIDEEISRYDLGVEIAHSMYLTYGVSFAVINQGGVRSSISAGDVTYADIFKVLPFENKVYIVTLSGSDLYSYITNPIEGIYYWGIDVNSLESDNEYRLAIVDFVYHSYTFANYRNDTCIDTNDLIRDVFLNMILYNN